jgi:hypothetical protein
MRWARLQKALQGIQSAGTNGFERVVATLPEQLLGGRFSGIHTSLDRG